MKFLEYEGKDIFKSYSIPVAHRYGVLKIGSELENLDLRNGPWVIKAQVLAGGRGKAGGVKIASEKNEAIKIIKNMLGMKIKTHQTKGQDLTVKEVLVEEASDIKREIYLSMTLDRKEALAMLIASAEGGMSIEELAKKHPEKIIKFPVDLSEGIHDFQVRKLSFALNIDETIFQDFRAIVQNLAKMFKEIDASLVEINPLAILKNGKLMAIDSKIVTDDNALFRHKFFAEKPDHESTEIEEEAKKIGINYISLDGNIGCMVNGAGLAMATLDTVKLAGGNAANFLDVGGGAHIEQITRAFNILLKDKRVKAILVNIFGGIMKCDNIATGIVQATRKVSLNVPLVVRLEGTNVEQGKEILANSGIKIEQANSLWEAAQKVTKAAG